MSDFSSQTELQNLIQGTKLRLAPGLICDLGNGWFDLLEEIIYEIKEISIEITCIDTSYGELDIQFSPYEDCDVSIAWGVIQIRRLISRTVCCNCGMTVRRVPLAPVPEVLCNPCQKERAKNGITGTWLDQY